MYNLVIKVSTTANIQIKHHNSPMISKFSPNYSPNGTFIDINRLTGPYRGPVRRSGNYLFKTKGWGQAIPSSSLVPKAFFRKSRTLLKTPSAALAASSMASLALSWMLSSPSLGSKASLALWLRS